MNTLYFFLFFNVYFDENSENFIVFNVLNVNYICCLMSNLRPFIIVIKKKEEDVNDDEDEEGEGEVEHADEEEEENNSKLVIIYIFLLSSLLYLFEFNLIYCLEIILS